jgi:hypothetical protein
MTGGLLSILSYGSTDLFLTGAPQITFFKIVYRRHTNFSVESIEIGLNTNINFDDEYEVIVDRIGDLIGKCYLKVIIPETYFNRNEFSLPLSEYNDTPDQEQNDYITVKTFMDYNMKAYRVAKDDIAVNNMTLLKLLTDINNQFAGPAGQNAILAYNNLQESQQSSEKIFSIMFNASIYNIYIQYQYDTNNSHKDMIFTQINNAINNSFICLKYFWNRYQQKKIFYTNKSTNNLKFAWNTNLGHNMIDYIDATLGGEQIDRHYGNLFEVSYQLNHHTRLDTIYNQLIGNEYTLTVYDEIIKPSYTITIPLKFWFNKNNGSAFPLIASQYSDLAFKMKFRNINQCGYIESIEGETYSLEDLWNDKDYRLQVSLLIDYIFLDGQERKKFAQSSHEYLIENFQTVTSSLSSLQSLNNVDSLTNESVINNKLSFSVDLGLKHPCKQIIWCFQKEKYLENKNGTQKCIYDNYAINISDDIDPLKNANLLLNGYDRMNKRLGTAKYYNLVQSYQHNTNSPNSGIYSYSFAIFPEELQPSSSCNFSRFISQTLQFDLDENMFYYANSDIDPYILSPQALSKMSENETVEYDVQIDAQQQYLSTQNYKKYNYTDVLCTLYAKCFNVLRIKNGFSSLAFSFN